MYYQEPGRKQMPYTHVLIKETYGGTIFKSIGNLMGWCSTPALLLPLGLNTQEEPVVTGS